MFETTHPFLFLDYFRIPSQATTSVDGALEDLPERHPLRSCGRLSWTANGRSTPFLSWPRGPLADVPPGDYRLESIPLPGRVLPENTVRDWLADTPGAWSPSTPILARNGASMASIWRDERGNVFLPFDPDEIIQNYWSEGYQTLSGPDASHRLKSFARRSYYFVRPALPRASQIALRRLFSRVQARSEFPRWPIETGLHDFYSFLFRTLAELAGEPVPWLSPWPNGNSWALVLTHDVETAVGHDNVHLLRDVEANAGYRSSWNFVPKRYQVDDAVLQDLTAAGFEVGVHGLHHDGRDLQSLGSLKSRLPDMRAYGQRWNAVGFRAPALQRGWELMPLLGFDYDSSYPDTDPFEPQGGGCCSWLPFFNQDLVELPVTLTQDHTVFVILRRPDETLWTEKATYLRDQGGMALLITHPDYMLGKSALQAYGRFLDRFRADDTAWRALPRDVSAWWRRRAASSLKLVGGEWQIVGPAAGEGSVRFSTA